MEIFFFDSALAEQSHISEKIIKQGKVGML